MSLMHSIVNLSLKHGKRTYDPQHPADYPAARATELQQNKFAQAPKSVLITADTVNGISVEWLTKPENPADKIILYISLLRYTILSPLVVLGSFVIDSW